MPTAPLRRFLQKGSSVVTLTSVTLLLALLALVSPLGAAESPAPRVGFLLALAASLEVLHGIRRPTAAARRKASIGALISMVIALLLINAPYLAGAALMAAMAGFFFVDAVRYGLNAWRETDRVAPARRAGHAGESGGRAADRRGARVGNGVDCCPRRSGADCRRRLDHRGVAGSHCRRCRGDGCRRARVCGQLASRGDGGRGRGRRNGARIGRSGVDPCVCGHALRDSRRPHGHRSHGARVACSGGRRRRRHGGGLAHRAAA